MKYWLESWKKCLSVSGCASRKEFWMFILWNMIVGFSFAFWLGLFSGCCFRTIEHPLFLVPILFFGVLSVIPTVSAAARRLHDIGKNGWEVMVFFIPIVGLVIIVYWLCRAGQNTHSDYMVTQT